MGTADRTCTRCGASVRAEATFCVRCGNSMSGDQQPVAAITEPVRSTEPLPAQPRDQMRRVALAGVLALILTLIARVAFSAVSSEPKVDGEIIATLPAGPDGASAKFDDGGKIKIPKGALKEERTITVRRTVLQDRVRAISPLGGSIVIPAGAQTVYIFGPLDIAFLRAVTIVLPLPPPPAQGIVFVSANGQITFIQGNPGETTISVRVNSFRFDLEQTFS